MDAWRTPDGKTLVAWRDEAPCRLPGGVERATSTFLLIGPGGLERTWDWRQSSVEDWLYTSAYFVADGALQCCFSGERDSGRETCSVSVELPGLVPLPAAEAPSREAITPLVRANDEALSRAREARQAADEVRLKRFREALRPVPGTDAVVLTFSATASGWVVSHGGEAWWRSTDWPWLGKGLHDQLSPIVKQHYAPRPARLEVDDATWRSLEYAND